MEIVTKYQHDQGDQRNDQESAARASGLAMAHSTCKSIEQTARTFAKPQKYDRLLLDSGKAKLDLKKEAFSSGSPVKDPYTGDVLILTRREARMAHGDRGSPIRRRLITMSP